MNHKPNLEASARGGKKTAQTFPKNMRQEWGRKGGLKHKPNLEGCAKAGRVSWSRRMAKAKVAEATAKAPEGISRQTKMIVQNPTIPWKGIF